MEAQSISIIPQSLDKIYIYCSFCDNSGTLEYYVSTIFLSRAPLYAAINRNMIITRFQWTEKRNIVIFCVVCLNFYFTPQCDWIKPMQTRRECGSRPLKEVLKKTQHTEMTLNAVTWRLPPAEISQVVLQFWDCWEITSKLISEAIVQSG